ncbi:MAG: hypothetical protein IPH36_22335 [Saprospiraceae bacterium]|nr:hypothetical protein [Saprospiraceae bacterium]
MKNVLLFCLSLFFIVLLSSQVARILVKEKITLEGKDLSSGSNPGHGLWWKNHHQPAKIGATPNFVGPEV